MDELDELSALFDMDDDPFLPVEDETFKTADEEPEQHDADLEAELAKLQEQMAKVKQQMESKKKKAGQEKATTKAAAVGLPLIPDTQPASTSKSKSFTDMFSKNIEGNETAAASSFNQEK